MEVEATESLPKMSSQTPPATLPLSKAKKTVASLSGTRLPSPGGKSSSVRLVKQRQKPTHTKTVVEQNAANMRKASNAAGEATKRIGSQSPRTVPKKVADQKGLSRPGEPRLLSPKVKVRGLRSTAAGSRGQPAKSKSSSPPTSTQEHSPPPDASLAPQTSPDEDGSSPPEAAKMDLSPSDEEQMLPSESVFVENNVVPSTEVVSCLKGTSDVTPNEEMDETGPVADSVPKMPVLEEMTVLSINDRPIPVTNAPASSARKNSAAKSPPKGTMTAKHAAAPSPKATSRQRTGSMAKDHLSSGQERTKPKRDASVPKTHVTDRRLSASHHSTSSSPPETPKPGRRPSSRNLKASTTAPVPAGRHPPAQATSLKEKLENTLNKLAQKDVELAETEAALATSKHHRDLLRKELGHCSCGFTAMTSLFRYLTEDLGAFDAPSLRIQCKATLKDLAEVTDALEKLRSHNNQLQVEIQDASAAHGEIIRTLNSEHSARLSGIQRELEEKHVQEIDRVIDQHSHEVNTLKSYHERNLLGVQKEYEAKANALRDNYDQEMATEREKQALYTQNLTAKYDASQREMNKGFEEAVASFNSKISQLKTECDELRGRAKHYEDAFQRDCDYKVSIAVQRYQNLPKEIDSLNSVLELKTAEIHQLREKNNILQRKVDEVCGSNDAVQRLQQKIENLEAIIAMKSDQEKHLSEKYRQLLKSFDKESREKKRLSCDNETLMWRLSQSMEGSDFEVDSPRSPRKPPDAPGSLAHLQSPRTRRKMAAGNDSFAGNLSMTGSMTLPRAGKHVSLIGSGTVVKLRSPGKKRKPIPSFEPPPKSAPAAVNAKSDTVDGDGHVNGTKSEESS